MFERGLYRERETHARLIYIYISGEESRASSLRSCMSSASISSSRIQAIPSSAPEDKSMRVRVKVGVRVRIRVKDRIDTCIS